MSGLEPLLDPLKRRLDSIDSVHDFATAMDLVARPLIKSGDQTSNPLVTARSVLCVNFPYYSAQRANLPSMSIPDEFDFYRNRAPKLPVYVTSLFRAPPCCLCNARPTHCRLIYLGQDDWCHAACVMWAGIRVSSRGNFSGLIRGLSQGLGTNAPKDPVLHYNSRFTHSKILTFKCLTPNVWPPNVWP